MTFHPKIEIKKTLEKEYTRRFLLGYGKYDPLFHNGRKNFHY